MTNYREILRLRSLGLNHSQIVLGAAVSRPTAIAVIQRAQAQGMGWQAAEGLSDRELAYKLNPPDGVKPIYKMSDYEYIHRELAKPGMTQQLLWFEYCVSGEMSYQLTQFKAHYREYVAKTKATMHTQRKPDELMEVDWAGQTAHLTDADTGEIHDVYLFVAVCHTAVMPMLGHSHIRFRRHGLPHTSMRILILAELHVFLRQTI